MVILMQVLIYYPFALIIQAVLARRQKGWERMGKEGREEFDVAACLSLTACDKRKASQLAGNDQEKSIRYAV